MVVNKDKYQCDAYIYYSYIIVHIHLSKLDELQKFCREISSELSR